MKPVSMADGGNVTAFMAVVAIALLMMAGLAWDGGQIISTHAETRSHAAKAARAGAQEIDITTLRQTGHTVLDPAAATEAAQAYLAEVGAAGGSASPACPEVDFVAELIKERDTPVATADATNIGLATCSSS